MTRYKVVRFYQGDHPPETVRVGLTLPQAETHCHDSEASSRTGTSRESRQRTKWLGPWFDTWLKETKPLDGEWPTKDTRELAGAVESDATPELRAWAYGLASNGDVGLIAERLARKLPARVADTVIPMLLDEGWLAVDWFYLARHFASAPEGTDE